MKSFLDHLKEEVLPSVQVADGALDIDKPAVRAAINAALAGVTSQPAVTPYVVFNRLSKLLAQYHIILPKRFLEGDKGVEVFELRQFGHRMGMTDSGEFVSEVPTTHYLFLQYGIITPFGITYAKPVVGGMFRVMARLVDKAELDKLIDMAEITMSEEAEQMQAIAKANAPKEELKDILDDPEKDGNKKAVETSEKDLSEERKNSAAITKAFASGKKAKMKTLQSHGDHVTYHGNKIASHVDGEVHLTAAGYGHSPSTRQHLNHISNHFGGERFSVKKSQLHYGNKPIGSDEVVKIKRSPTVSEDKDPCWDDYEMVGMKKGKKGKPVPNCVLKSEIGESTDKDRELSNLANKAISKGHPVKKLPAGRAEYAVLPKRTVKGNIEKGRWSGHGKFGLGEEVHVKKWSDGTHTAKINRGEGKSPHVISRKSEKDLHKEILSRYPSLKGKIPKASPVTPVKEEKGDRLIPGFSNRKDFENIAKEIGTGQGGMSIVPKGDDTKQTTLNPMSQKSNNRVSREGSKNEYGEGGSLQEKLTKKMSAGDVIHDFVHSKSKTFKGDTKKQRIKRALGAYYGKKKVDEEKKVVKGKMLVTLKFPNKEEKKHIQGGGGVMSIPKSKYDPKKHNLASE